MRSGTAWPRRWSKALSTRSSNREIRARTSSGTSGTLKRYLGRYEREEFLGLGRVAAPRRAVLAERAPLAQAGRPRLEVLGLAGPLDGMPDRRGPLLEPLDRLLGGLGDDGHRLLQIQQLDAVGPAPEQPLAKEGVEVHAAEPPLLVPLLGCASRFVIGDHQPPGVELQPVDDAAQAQRSELDLKLQFESDG